MTKKDFKYIEEHKHVRYQTEELSEFQIEKRALDFYNFLDKRRSVREFSEKPIPREVIENIVKTENKETQIIAGSNSRLTIELNNYKFQKEFRGFINLD